MAVSIAITSGKGGAGKTSLAVNMALRLAEKRGRTVLFDGDFATPNAHILLKCRPLHDVSSIVMGDARVTDILHEGPRGLQLAAGRTAALEMHDLESARKDKLIRAFNDLEAACDYLVVDTAAGAEEATLDCAAAADHVVVILVGQATSFVDAYAIIKAGYQGYGIDRVSIVVNMARSAEEARTLFANFETTVRRFMPVELAYCGHLPFSAAMQASSVHCTPVALQRGCFAENRALDSVAESILTAPTHRAVGTRYFGDLPATGAVPS